MRWFYSHLKNLCLVFGIFIFHPLCPVSAEDIEIDLGSNQTPIPKSSLPISKQKAPLAQQKTEAGEPTPKDNSVSATTSPRMTLSKVASVVNQVSISTEGGGTLVSIDGIGLPRPQVNKISSQKILVKLLKTKLKIPSRIIGNSQVVKTIRSSTHPGNTAWIVLDVTGVKKWDITQSKTGYLLTLNSSSGGLNKPSKESSVEETSAVNENPMERKLFSRLIDASFKPVEKGIKLVLTSDGPSKYTVHKLSQPEKLVIRFHNTKLEVAEKLKKFKSEDSEFQKGGIVLMELRQIGPSFSPISEAVLTLVPGAIHQIDRDLNQVIITFTAPPLMEKSVEKKGNLNQLVSLDIEGADLNAVVKTLSSEAGFNVDLVSGPLVGVVNEKFKDIPLKTALATLLSPGGYDFEVQGNTLRVGLQSTLIASKGIMPHIVEILSPSGGMTPDQFNTLVHPLLKPTNAIKYTPDTVRNLLILNGTPSDIEDYKRAIKDLKLDESSNSDRIIRVVKLNYANPVTMQGILGTYLTPVGKIQIDGQKLVVWETATNMGVLLELVKELDHKPAQVLIESNIVEIDSEKDLNVGINWSANTSAGDPTIRSAFNNPPVNAQGFPGSFTFGTIKSGLNISANLQALETHKKGKIISRPRIATASGVIANINTVENVIVASTTQSVAQGGILQITTTFVTVPLPINLSVLPRITDDGRITTIVNASITSQTGPAQAGAPPPTSVQTANTTITTKNGETIVIGGLVRELAQDVVNGIPLLSSLPIIGTLFQEHEKTNRKVELVIFITPTLLED